MIRQFEKRGKKVQKMTRDGLVEQNLDTGEEVRVSQRGQDFNLRQEQPPDSGRGTGAPPGAAQGLERQTEIRRDIPLRPEAARDDSGAGAERRSRAAYRRGYDESGPTTSPTPDLWQAADARAGAGTSAPTQSADTGESAEQGADTAEYPERQRFTEGAEHPAPSGVPRNTDSPRQHGTGYSRRFEPEAQAPPAPDTRRPNAPTPAAEHPGKLQFTESAKHPASSGVSRPDSSRQHGTEYSRRFGPEARTSPTDGANKSNTPKPGAAGTVAGSEPAKPSRLQFAHGESAPAASPSPDKKLQRLQNRADNVNVKLEKAREQLPARNKVKRGRVYDKQKGKARSRFQFEKEPLAPGQKRLTPPAAIAKDGARMARQSVQQQYHRKIYEVEHENVGIAAAHRMELAVEGTARAGGRSVRAALPLP